jgi:hypothetical protein
MDEEKDKPNLADVLAARPAARETLRDIALRSSSSPLRKVEINGQNFFFKSPKVKRRAKMLASLQHITDDAERMSTTQARAAILCAVDEKGEPLFSDGDFDLLADADSGSTLDLVGIHAIKAVNLEAMIEAQKKD